MCVLFVCYWKQIHRWSNLFIKSQRQTCAAVDEYKEQLAQARCCGLEILINVFLKAVSHAAIHPRTREKKIFTARDQALQVFVRYWNLRLKAAQIYPELFLCLHAPKWLFAIGHSVCIWGKMIVNTESNTQLVFLHPDILPTAFLLW